MTEPVPTASDLVKMGSKYAEATGWTTPTRGKPAEPTVIRIHPAGHALMGEVMRRNAAEAVAAGAGDWHPNPPHRRSRNEQ